MDHEAQLDRGREADPVLDQEVDHEAARDPDLVQPHAAVPNLVVDIAEAAREVDHDR